jgi:uncharacterized membrane-anchored protein YjiN (DUF445 family)
MKTMATGLLVAAAAVFVAARALEPSISWLGYVRATAEAAMVGALADWFAVTALFRRPLGLPIPHTAIIQTRKDQIGNSLGGFVRDNFLTAEVVTERLAHAGLAARIGDWLADPANAKTVSAQSAAAVRGVTEVLQDDLVQGGVEHLVATRVRGLPAAPLVGKVIDAAVDGDHHQVLLEGVLTSFESFLDENRQVFRQRLEEESPWWVPDTIDDVVFDRLYRGVKSFLADLKADRDHQMRIDIDHRAAKLAEALKTSPEMRAKGEELKEELLAHPEVRAWSASLWTRIKTSILEAADDPGSELRLRLEQALVEAGQSLQRDPVLQAKIDLWIIEATGYVADQFRNEVADLIGSTVRRWDARETAERLELQVGRDLQFIRINGTLVGGLAGLAIYTVSELFLRA